MKQGELFAGIGGFGLAGRWAGIESVFQVEIDQFCQKVLKKNFPNAQQFGDIREFDGRQFAGAIDIISGGFPCQPYSQNGERRGKDDERHLWPEMLRIIREIQPRWIVGENVRGLVDWSAGLVFDEVQAELEASGYQVTAFILPAASVGAPHERYRTWIVAHSERNRLEGRYDKATAQKRQAAVTSVSSLVENKNWHQYAKSFVCGTNDGVPNRLDRIGCLGNAIVPQVAYRIFDTIKQYENRQT